MTAPDTLNWAINGDSVTAWANDLEMFDISPDSEATRGRSHRLTINHVGHVQAFYLGSFLYIVEAKDAAKRHVGLGA